MTSYRFVMRSYPEAYRKEHGDELVDTANELAGDVWSIRQSGSLLVGGVRTRANAATGGDPKRTWAWGLSVGLVATWLATGLSLLLFTSGAIDSELTVGVGRPPSSTALLIGAFAAVAAAIALATSTRPKVVAVVAVFLGLTTVGVWVASDSHGLGFLTSLVLDLAALWFIARHGDHRGVLSHRIVWGTAVVLVVAAFLFNEPFVPNLLIAALVIFGLLLLVLDPRWTIAAAVPTTIQLVSVSMATWDVVSISLLGIIAVILMLAHRSINRLQTL